jgi:hypothetical protein
LPLPVAQGGTNATAAGVTAAHNIGAAAQGANSDITSLTGLTTPLSVAQGGSGTATPSLVPGNNVTITGSWPNQTITASGGGGGSSPINLLPNQTGNYNAQGFRLTNVGAPTTSGDTLVQASPASVTTMTATTSMTSPFYQNSAPNPAASGLVRDVNAATSLAARNAANTADIPEIGTTSDNTVHVGGVGALGISLDNSSSVSQGVMSSGAYIDKPQIDSAWKGNTEACANTWHSFTIAATATLTLSCPVDSFLHRLEYKIYQPTMGSTFTYNFVATNGGAIYTPLGGPMPAPCSSNGCYDQLEINWEPSRNIYSIQYIGSFAPLSVGSTTCGGTTCYYVDSVGGSDSNSGSIVSPFQNIGPSSKVQSLITAGISPGTQFLFKAGDTWTAGGTGWSGTSTSPAINLPSGTNGTAVSPIVFTAYGSGAAPVIDGASGTAQACFWANVAGGSPPGTPAFSYITINGFECKSVYAEAVDIEQSYSSLGTAGMPGITVQNMNIHNTGSGCATTTGTCTTSFAGGTITSSVASGGNVTLTVPTGNPFVSGQTVTIYNNGGVHNGTFTLTSGTNATTLIYADASGTSCSSSCGGSQYTSGVCGPQCGQLQYYDHNAIGGGAMFSNNTVLNTGGFNAVSIDGDLSSPLASNNTIGNFRAHGISFRRTKTGTMLNNSCSEAIVANGNTTCYYGENNTNGPTNATVAAVTFQGNVAYSNNSDLSNGFGCEPGTGTLNIICHAYNNTFYGGGVTALIKTAATSLTSWDVRNNIADTADPMFVCNTANYNACGEMATWDYNDDGGKTGGSTAASTWTNMTGQGAHDILNKDPLYVSQSTGNFHLSAGSPCLNTGLTGLTQGNNDIGAF